MYYLGILVRYWSKALKKCEVNLPIKELLF